MPVAPEELALLREGRFGLVSEGEERFLGPEPLPGLHEGDDLVGRHGVRARFARIAAEGAVAAVIAAQGGEGYEDLLREGDGAPTAAVAQRTGRASSAGARRRAPLTGRTRARVRRS